MRRAHTPTIATDGRYLFSKLAFCFGAICKNETPARVVLTFARARFDSNENQDGEFLSFAV